MIQEAGRLFRVFVAPGETFRELREKPTWVLGFLVDWALATAAAFAVAVQAGLAALPSLR